MYLPHLTIYTDNLPANVGGRANGPVIRIQPQYKDDAGIHAHELEHVRQWYTFVALGVLVSAILRFAPAVVDYSTYWPLAAIIGAGVHPLLYLAVPSYRLWAEVQAYRVQAGYYPDDRMPLFAGYIAANYRLSVTVQAALMLLRG